MTPRKFLAIILLILSKCRTVAPTHGWNETRSLTLTKPAILQCIFCSHSHKQKDLKNGNFQQSACLNHSKFLYRSDLRRDCGESEKFCKSTVTNLNGIFIEIDRDCARTCKKGCEQRGYGLFQTTCTRCCKEPLCNKLDEIAYYRALSANTPSFCIMTVLILAMEVFG